MSFVVLFVLVCAVSIIRDQVFGQQPIPSGVPHPSFVRTPYPVETPPNYNAYNPSQLHNTPPSTQPANGQTQVTIRPPKEPPRWLVEFTPIDDPINPTQKIMAITVVDPESKRILIYHANLSFGALKFVSSRDILPDILLGEYNAVSPTPREILSEIERLKNTKQ
ncbi:MAG: hypothetical protein LBQ66_03765 [Planctomycetaceae bacterium]|nr:hypothetical protein [Planctomycetaceae bacterium]